ncbi:uncharacterized protein V1518DRAFT_419695 [Limtongia smithiae]|uniref:uncharacterized protein n=1 Tax=Limtongia smithiae TaxID=1125753 RepID=UPI0034CE388A
MRGSRSITGHVHRTAASAALLFPLIPSCRRTSESHAERAAVVAHHRRGRSATLASASSSEQRRLGVCIESGAGVSVVNGVGLNAFELCELGPLKLGLGLSPRGSALSLLDLVREGGGLRLGGHVLLRIGVEARNVPLVVRMPRIGDVVSVVVAKSHGCEEVCGLAGVVVCCREWSRWPIREQGRLYTGNGRRRQGEGDGTGGAVCSS